MGTEKYWLAQTINNYFLGAEDHKGESALTFLFHFLLFACHCFFLFRCSCIILIVSLDCVSQSWHRNYNHLKQSKNKKRTSEECGCITNWVWNHHNSIPGSNTSRSSYYSNFQEHICLLKQREVESSLLSGRCPTCIPSQFCQKEGSRRTDFWR